LKYDLSYNFNVKTATPCCAIIPPYIFQHIALFGSDRQRRFAFLNLNGSSELRGERKAFLNLSAGFAIAPGARKRSIYDARNGMVLPGKLVRSEGASPVKDVSVNEAYAGTGRVFDFFSKAFGRNSIDDKGMQMDSTVHYRRKFSNAFWNGQQMVFGDGDGEIFQRFTGPLDIIAHELTHGVTQFEAGLQYVGDSGALNEHLSDVFGALAKQYRMKQKASNADWVIGAGLLTEKINGVGIRSMKNPGTAYDDPVIGKDMQPAHMDNYVRTTEDNGGVHINSGIPNKAFYNLAVSLGGHAWIQAGKIWYTALVERVRSDTGFQGFAQITFEVAGALYGAKSKEQKAVTKAWAEVGIGIE